jgi:hypothetical protein
LRGEGWRLELPLGTGTVPADRGRGRHWLRKCPSLSIAPLNFEALVALLTSWYK